MGRRRYLKNLKALGISGLSLRFLSQNSLAKQTGDLKDEVPYVAYLAANNPEAEFSDADENGRAPIYRKMAYDEWVYTEGVHNAALAINNKLKKASNSDLITTRVGSAGTGSERNLAVKVDYWKLREVNGSTRTPDIDFESIIDLLPDKQSAEVGEGRNNPSVEGIDVLVDKKVAEQQAYFDSKYRPVPGGCKIAEAGIEGYDADSGTLGTPAYHHGENEHVMVSAGHLIDNSGQRCHQPSEPLGGGNRIGYMRENSVLNKFDAEWIELDPEDDFDYDIAADGGGTEGWNIDGIIGWGTIKGMVDTGYDLYLQGKTTGRNSGELTGYDTGTGNNEKRLWIDVDSDKGDSGGPHYRKIGDYIYIAGIHGWGSGTKAVATAMEAIEDEFGLEVNPNL